MHQFSRLLKPNIILKIGNEFYGLEVCRKRQCNVFTPLHLVEQTFCSVKLKTIYKVIHPDTMKKEVTTRMISEVNREAQYGRQEAVLGIYIVWRHVP